MVERGNCSWLALERAPVSKAMGLSTAIPGEASCESMTDDSCKEVTFGNA